MNKISCLICGVKSDLQKTFLNTLESVFNDDDIHYIPENIDTRICDYESLKTIAKIAADDYVMLVTNAKQVDLIQQSMLRFLQIAEMTDAEMLYSDYNELKDGKLSLHPLTDHHEGCVRDDFDLGNILLINTHALRAEILNLDKTLKYGALYALRLQLTRHYAVERIPEPLYTVSIDSCKHCGESQFEYVNPANRDVQIEMEKVFTAYLKQIGAFVKPNFRELNLSDEIFKTEVSIIIPVKDRAKTIQDAIESALVQECNFPFNIILVDNDSTDGTTKIIEKLAHKNQNIIHLIPECKTLGIGGCWNLAVNHPECGKFAVQLDSDDMYNTPFTIDKIVKTFYANSCAMVIGSYQMMNFENQPIAPGLIDHAEWTEDNGHNNALRINGLGAPRAFYTPILRETLLPNTSYGEDYATGLTLSRKYKIGRIYDPIYNCRRWEGNSDANLDIIKLNSYNAYKDRIRYFEIKKRLLHNRY
jgi:hypothetical protein